MIHARGLGRRASQLLPLVMLGFAYFCSYRILASGAERLSLRITVGLAVEVAAICLLVASPLVYVTFRYCPFEFVQRLLLSLAVVAFIVPTIARSLVVSAFFSYYGPVATGP